jgi:adenylate kinase
VEGAATFSLFSLRGDPAKAKLIVLGSERPEWLGTLRSLNIEHVSPTQLVRSGISRSSQGGQSASELSQLAAVRRWFWTRKPDAGFVLIDFPATLLQAKVFDEWLDARGEHLTACLLTSMEDSASSLAEHYRTHGLDLFGPLEANN